MTTIPSPVLATPDRLRSLGPATIVAGVLGAASAVVIIAWPDQVSDRQYSYPFDPAAYTVAQLWFAVQHLGLLAGMYALARRAWPATSPVARGALGLSLVGVIGLTVCELFALSAADALVGTGRANAVDSSYGAPMIAIGLGLVVAGIAIARAPVLVGAGRWLPLALGAYVFVPLLPAVFGPLVLGRIAVGGWMLLFAGLGVALVRAREPRSDQ